MIIFTILFSILALCNAWINPVHTTVPGRGFLVKTAQEYGPSVRRNTVRAPSTNLAVLSSTAASLLAGSVAGAVGVGVAFPLDTIKTKALVNYASARDGRKVTALDVFFRTIRHEGIGGFFAGVRLVMIGEALACALAFAANAFGLAVLEDKVALLPYTLRIALAATFAGILTSFVIVPYERIKIMMQVTGQGISRTSRSAIEISRFVVQKEGLTGLFGRGLGPTLAREIPSCILYFLMVRSLAETTLAQQLGKYGPLLFGAISGSLSLLPVYPVDVVKTLVQTSSSRLSSWQVAVELYRKEGISAFFEGITPNMVRAAINHAVTFYFYELIVNALIQPAVVVKRL